METLAPLPHAPWERQLCPAHQLQLGKFSGIVRANDAAAGPLLAPGPGGQAAPSSHQEGWHLQHSQTALWLLVEQPWELRV